MRKVDAIVKTDTGFDVIITTANSVIDQMTIVADGKIDELNTLATGKVDELNTLATGKIDELNTLATNTTNEVNELMEIANDILQLPNRLLSLVSVTQPTGVNQTITFQFNTALVNTGEGGVQIHNATTNTNHFMQDINVGGNLVWFELPIADDTIDNSLTVSLLAGTVSSVGGAMFNTLETITFVRPKIVTHIAELTAPSGQAPGSVQIFVNHNGVKGTVVDIINPGDWVKLVRYAPTIVKSINGLCDYSWAFFRYDNDITFDRLTEIEVNRNSLQNNSHDVVGFFTCDLRGSLYLPKLKRVLFNPTQHRSQFDFICNTNIQGVYMDELEEVSTWNGALYTSGFIERNAAREFDIGFCANMRNCKIISAKKMNLLHLNGTTAANQPSFAHVFSHNNSLTKILLPELKEVRLALGHRFLQNNMLLTEINLPALINMGIGGITANISWGFYAFGDNMNVSRISMQSLISITGISVNATNHAYYHIASNNASLQEVDFGNIIIDTANQFLLFPQSMSNHIFQGRTTYIFRSPQSISTINANVLAGAFASINIVLNVNSLWVNVANRTWAGRTWRSITLINADGSLA